MDANIHPGSFWDILETIAGQVREASWEAFAAVRNGARSDPFFAGCEAGHNLHKFKLNLIIVTEGPVFLPFTCYIFILHTYIFDEAVVCRRYLEFQFFSDSIFCVEVVWM